MVLSITIGYDRALRKIIPKLLVEVIHTKNSPSTLPMNRIYNLAWLGSYNTNAGSSCVQQRKER